MQQKSAHYGDAGLRLRKMEQPAMKVPSRNAACPCGSGKKSKKCCFALQEIAPVAPAPLVALAPFTKNDRERGFALLYQYAMSGAFATDLSAVAPTFWGKRMLERTVDEVERTMKNDSCSAGFNTWFTFDHPLRGGATICERFLALRNAPLSPRERRYLERMSKTRMGLYEIADVQRDEGMTLVDLWTNDRLEVTEKLLTRQVFRFDIIGARVVLGPCATLELDGAVYPFSQSDKEPLLAALGRDVVLQARQTPVAEEMTVLKRAAGATMNRYFVETMLFRPFPRITTPEGHELMPSRVIFDVRDDARKKLAGHPRFGENEDDSLTLYVSPKSSQIIGTLRFGDGGLVVETMSAQRADKARRFLSKVLGTF